ncbi:aminoacyl-tRNA hydrolase [soil metagenome]
MKIVVGLGTPGQEYSGTRHNVGFEVVEQFANRLGWIASPEKFGSSAKNKFNGLVIDGVVDRQSGGTEKILLLEPLTYMNLSGQSVQAAMAFYNVFPQDLMVVLDDLALPTGRLRLRGSGSSGGHNGLKDIERAIGTNEYPRLRLGIDAPPERVPGKDYVLGRFSGTQRQLLDPAIGRACGAIVTWIDQGLNAAMNQFNQKDEG